MRLLGFASHRSREQVSLLGGDDVDHSLQALAKRCHLIRRLLVLRKEDLCESRQVLGELSSPLIRGEKLG